jgi:hypothetical protein
MRQHAEAPDPDEQVELGAEVSIRRERPSGPVLAIRVPRDVLARLSEYATTRGLTVSEVVRQAAIGLVSPGATSGPYYVTGAPLEGTNIVSGVQQTKGGRVLNREFVDDSTAAISRS